MINVKKKKKATLYDFENSETIDKCHVAFQSFSFFIAALTSFMHVNVCECVRRQREKTEHAPIKGISV